MRKNLHKVRVSKACLGYYQFPTSSTQVCASTTVMSHLYCVFLSRHISCQGLIVLLIVKRYLKLFNLKTQLLIFH
uniref:Uncharacterized protein n=1 Tax=Anguilla anguilla TaxID=7936 RepID=A0A0E9X698_ANGAN